MSVDEHYGLHTTNATCSVPCVPRNGPQSLACWPVLPDRFLLLVLSAVGGHVRRRTAPVLLERRRAFRGYGRLSFVHRRRGLGLDRFGQRRQFRCQLADLCLVRSQKSENARRAGSVRDALEDWKERRAECAGLSFAEV